MDQISSPAMVGRRRYTSRGLPLTAAQVIVLLAAFGGALIGFVLTGAQASGHAILVSGPDFTRLLRAMALIKSLMAIAAASAITWRLATPASPIWTGAYASAVLAMAIGPGLIWGMVHVGSGALLLHGGLLASVVLVWRDPAVAMRLAGLVQKRRLALRR